MKKWLCIFLAMLLVGCNQPTVPQESPQEIPPVVEQPVEEVVVPEEPAEKPIEEPAEEAVEPLKGEWSEELTALMEIINEEHKSVGKPAVEEYKKYVQTPLKTPAIEVASANEDGSFSLAQAEADVRYFYATLQGGYGLYDYFGGDEVFFAKRDETIEALRAAEKLTVESFAEIVRSKLDFIVDLHFNFNDRGTIEKTVTPFFCTGLSFEKCEEGYRTEGGKIVQSVDGYENLDELFKRSLTISGDIVYYAVVMVDSINGMMETPAPLVLTYTDGSTQELQPVHYQKPTTEHEEMTWLERKDNVPIFGSLGCNIPAFAEGGNSLKGEPVSIMDMRFNGGGRFEVVSAWFSNYTDGVEVPANLISILRYPNYVDDSYPGYMPLEKAAAIHTEEDGFVENENLLIVLTSKRTGSGAEAFTDTVHNLENTLIIGSNTVGCLAGSSGNSGILPNSRIKFKFGVSVQIFSDSDHFSETYGLEPDLWCPPHYAEEAALNFIKKHVK